MNKRCKICCDKPAVIENWGIPTCSDCASKYNETSKDLLDLRVRCGWMKILGDGMAKATREVWVHGPCDSYSYKVCAICGGKEKNCKDNCPAKAWKELRKYEGSGK